MTIVNDSTETITYIKVRPSSTYIDINSKFVVEYNSLDNNQTVEPTTSVEFTLPAVAYHSSFEITLKTSEGTSWIDVLIDGDYIIGNDFTLNYKGHLNESPRFELTGEGVSFDIN